MNYLLRTLGQRLDVIIMLRALFGAKALQFDIIHVYFQFQITIPARFNYIILVTATSVASLLNELEVVIQPLLTQLFEIHAVYGDYSEEILDVIYLLIDYIDTPDVFILNMCDKIMNLQDVDHAINGSRIINIASQYINTSVKFKVSLNNFIGKDMINRIVTQNDDEFVSELVLCAAIETVFASYEDKKDMIFI